LRDNNLAVLMIEAPPASNAVLDSTTYPSALLPFLDAITGEIDISSSASTRPRGVEGPGARKVAREWLSIFCRPSTDVVPVSQDSRCDVI